MKSRFLLAFTLAFAAGGSMSAKAQVELPRNPTQRNLGPQTARIASELLKLAREREASGDWSEAEQVLSELLMPDSRQAALQGELAQVLMAQQKWEDAVSTFTLAEQVEPDNAEWPGNRGVALDRLGQRDAAESAFRRAVQLAPDEAQWHSNLAWILVQRKLLPEAEAEFRQAIRCEPQEVQWTNNLGLVLLAQGKAPQAEIVLRQALELDGKNGEAQLRLGQALMQQQKWDGAIAVLRAASELDTSEPLSPLLLGNALLRRSQIEEAETAFHIAINRQAQNAPAYFGLAQALWQKGDKASQAAALEAFSQASRLLPNNLTYRHAAQRAQNALRSQEQRTTLAQSLDGAYVGADIIAFDHPLPDDSLLAQSFNTLGNTLFDCNKWDAAAFAFQQASSLSPDEARYYANQAGALLKLGRLPQAKEKAELAQKLGLKTHWTFPLLGLRSPTHPEQKAPQ